MQLAVEQGEGFLVADGAFSASTGRHTGRAPRDRYIVERAEVAGAIDWGKVNQPLEAAAAERLWAKARAYAGERELYVQDLHAGADAALPTQGARGQPDVMALHVRAQHVHPVRGQGRAHRTSKPDVTVLHAAESARPTPKPPRNRGETAIVLVHLSRRRIVLIGGTALRRRDQEGLFAVLNFMLPEHDVLPMHCSAKSARPES